MSSSVYIRYKESIPFDKYSLALGLKWNPEVMGEGIFYYNTNVQVEYAGKEIIVSSYHMTNLVAIADMAKNITALTNPISVTCDEELKTLIQTFDQFEED